MSRVPIMAGNWKMNLGPTDAAVLARDIVQETGQVTTVEQILCPPFVSLPAVKDAVSGSALRVGAQNAHAEPGGAFTGEVSAPMLTGLADYVILGHSERRQYCHETDDEVNAKLHAVLETGLVPIVCVGESLEENQAGQTRAVVTRQVRGALANVTGADAGRLVIAYEPVWAIGSGLAATPEVAEEVCGEIIRILLADLYDGTVAETTRILYGGSTSPGNIVSYMESPDIDGALIGGSALKSDTYTAMVRLTAGG